MSWSYRIIKTVTKIPLGDTDISYAIHTVYSDENGTIVNISKNPSYPIVDDAESLQGILKRMMTACDKPVIDYHTMKEIN